MGNLAERRQYNVVLPLSQSVHTDQLTLSYRCWKCNTTLPIFTDQNGDYLLVPTIFQGDMVNGVLSVPVNREVSEVRLNVTSTGAAQMEVLLHGEATR